MIYFENHCNGRTGLNNHVVPYTLSIAISNFLGRDFFFDYEIPTITLPEVSASGPLKRQLEHVMNSKRSLVSDLLDIPNRRRFEIDRTVAKQRRIDDPMMTFMTDNEQREKLASTMIWNCFSLGREAFVKEELDEFELVEFGNNCIINASFYFFLGREAKRQLLDSIRIRYADELERLAEKIVSSVGRFNAIHLRLGDFRSVYGPDGYSVESEEFGNLLNAIFADRDVPVLIATDGFQEKELFSKMLAGFRYEFIDEMILGDFFEDLKTLRFSDFNVLSVLTQLVCAGSENFVGTCRSTFTSVIHRIRQERNARVDFNFFPDARVSRHLDAEFNVVPDGQGFFEWNRYSAFAEHYEYPAWMREWNYELTAV
jgi:hypothetical protein